MIRSVRNTLRLARLAFILARHDALFPLETLGIAPGMVAMARLVRRRNDDRRPGQRLTAALSAMGPSFVKFGQALSTRADLLSERVADDLGRLVDHMPPYSAAQARRTIETELGQPVEALFESFDDVPIAAASIAQVHFARTLAGENVAVKILRPGIEAAFARDMDLFYWLANLVERARPVFRRLKPVESVRAFAEVTRVEMDLRMEAAAAEELGANFADNPDYRAPKIWWDLTARRVLTMERIEGIPIGDRERLAAAGHDLDAVLRKSAEAFFYQVFRDGFFHGDMHGGNAFVDAEGRIVPVDFGIMGRVDTATRGYLAELLIAFLRRDYRAVAEVQFRAGYIRPDKSVEVFAQACRSVGEPIFGKPSSQISIARLLAQLLRVTEQFEMSVQPQLLLLQKTMLMAEGMGTKLNASVNIWELARPLIEDWMIQHFGPRARVERLLGDTLDAARRLPLLIDTLEQMAERERRRVEHERVQPPPAAPGGFGLPRPGWSGVVVAAALAAALVAWLR